MSTSFEQNVEEFTITSKREIVFYLRQLINDGERISVTFNEGKETFLTVLLDLDEEKNLLVLDWGGSEDANQLFLKSARNLFVATPQGVRNQFITGPAKEVVHNKRKAFAVTVPDRYVRLQRREYFRLSLPITRRLPCTFTDKQGRAWEVPVVDISLGGVGLEVAAQDVPFQIGDILPAAKVNMEGFGVLGTDLAVRFVGENHRVDKKVWRIGCSFVKLSGAQENHIQRFITHIQREEWARVGGQPKG